MRFLFLALLQGILVLWLHLNALRRNRVALQRALVWCLRNGDTHTPLWINGRDHSFYMCPDCVAVVVG
jgi:hypothetical protein